MTAFKYAPILTTLPLKAQGKSRDTFATLRDDELLIGASNRLSTHNIVHVSPIPHKGDVLTALTVFWFTQIFDGVLPHHLVAYGSRIYDHLPGKRSDYPADLHHCAIIVKALNIVPIEFIFRARLGGSLYNKWYVNGLDPYGLKLPSGLPLMHSFMPPLFTPTDKSEDDEERVTQEVLDTYPEECELMAEVYDIGRTYLRSKNIEVVDFKGECGRDRRGVLTVGDEVLTPDCCRFVEAGTIVLSQEPKWLDKQLAREEAERIWAGGPKYAIKFDREVVTMLSKAYLTMFERITGQSLEAFQREWLD